MQAEIEVILHEGNAKEERTADPERLYRRDVLSAQKLDADAKYALTLRFEAARHRMIRTFCEVPACLGMIAAFQHYLVDDERVSIMKDMFVGFADSRKNTPEFIEMNPRLFKNHIRLIVDAAKDVLDFRQRQWKHSFHKSAEPPEDGKLQSMTDKLRELMLAVRYTDTFFTHIRDALDQPRARLSLLQARLATAGEIDTPEHLEILALCKTVMMSFPDLERICHNIRQGTHEAAIIKNTLVEAHLTNVMGLTRKFVKTRSPRYLDCVQDGNIALMDSVDRFDCHRGNTLWTYAQHRVRAAVTRHSASPFISLSDLEGSGESDRHMEDHSSGGHPLDIYLQKDMRNAATQALAAFLTPREERVLRLRLDDNTLEEIGERMRLGPGTVRLLEASALRKLQTRPQNLKLRKLYVKLKEMHADL